MRVETDEAAIIERVAALDVGKAEVVCCARVPGPGRQRLQEVRTTSAMTTALLGLGDCTEPPRLTVQSQHQTGDASEAWPDPHAGPVRTTREASWSRSSHCVIVGPAPHGQQSREGLSLGGGPLRT